MKLNLPRFNELTISKYKSLIVIPIIISGIEGDSELHGNFYDRLKSQYARFIGIPANLKDKISYDSTLDF